MTIVLDLTECCYSYPKGTGSSTFCDMIDALSTVSLNTMFGSGSLSSVLTVLILLFFSSDWFSSSPSRILSSKSGPMPSSYSSMALCEPFLDISRLGCSSAISLS